MVFKTAVAAGDRMLILGGIGAAAFNYSNFPAIGQGIDGCMLKGLQSALGMMAGITAGMLLEPGEDPYGIFGGWFGAHKGDTAWKAVMMASLTGTLACLVVPDNKAIQAGAVFLVPIMKKWSDWNFNNPPS